MKKLFTLLTLALGICSGAWAGTETPGNPGSSNVDVVGTSYTIAGTYVAGSGGVKVSPMESKGVKVRLNTGNILVIKPNAGYEINSFSIYAVTNDNTKTNSVTSIKVGETEKLTSAITIPNKKASAAATITLSGIDTQEDITLTFSTAAGEATQGVFDFHFTYTQKEVITQEISAVTLNGANISSADLATLKSDKAVTIDGSALNGLVTVGVTLSSGATTVTRSISGDNAVYTFTINTTDTYTVTVTDIAKSYTKTGTVIAYKEGDSEATGTNTNTVKMNGISFAMVDGGKTFQYGSGKVTLGSTEYVPLKLSTGSKVNVTFPDGTVATKVKIYGWSANGNGTLNFIKETDDAEAKTVGDISGDVYYATNTADDIYPSVYEYNLDNWSSMCFNPGGSASQPFVVMEFTLQTSITPAYAKTTYVTPAALDFTTVSGLDAYVATSVTATSVKIEKVTEAVPAGTPLLLIGTAGTEYTVPVAASATAPATNLLVAGDGTTEFDGTTYDYILCDGLFYRIGDGTVATTKAYLHLDSAPASRSLNIVFGDEATGINMVQDSRFMVHGSEYFNLNGQRISQPSKGLYILNGKKLMVK